MNLSASFSENVHYTSKFRLHLNVSLLAYRPQTIYTPLKLCIEHDSMDLQALQMYVYAHIYEVR